VIITSFIGGFKEYSSVVGIFGEGMGPGDNGQMNTIVGYVYKMLPKSQLGNASAASLILFGIILIVTAINGYVSKKSVHY
ncbi:MAG: sugar ABC transporter permease, partial [Clostridia bacterium]|nr:sugar ABC transporter permease [Clostridia bacterium]